MKSYDLRKKDNKQTDDEMLSIGMYCGLVAAMVLATVIIGKYGVNGIPAAVKFIISLAVAGALADLFIL